MPRLSAPYPPTPMLQIGSTVSMTSAFVVDIVEYVEQGVDVGFGHHNNASWETNWAISDGRLLPFKERNLGGRVYTCSGLVQYRAPHVNSTRFAITSPSQTGTGFVTMSRPTTRRGLLQGLSSNYTMPSNEVESADIKLAWVASTGIVDTTVTGSPNAPKYRIYGSGLYGPTGYWVTKSRADIRINQTLTVDWYATDFECAVVSYSMSVNGSVVSTGTMNSGTHKTYALLCDTAEDLQLSVTISDENGETVEIQGPLLQVQNVPIYTGEILIPVEESRYRVGVPISSRFHYPKCEAWSIIHRFNGTSEEIGRGILIKPDDAVAEIFLPNPLGLGTHYLDLVLYDTIGAQDPADTVQFYVTEYGELLSS